MLRYAKDDFWLHRTFFPVIGGKGEMPMTFYLLGKEWIVEKEVDQLNMLKLKIHQNSLEITWRSKVPTYSIMAFLDMELT
jgi:hypothetical protein